MNVYPRVIFEGDFTKAVQWTGLGKKFARECAQLGVLDKRYEVAPGISITVKNFGQGLVNVFIRAEGGHGFIVYPKDEDNPTGFYFPDEPAFDYPTEHPYPPIPPEGQPKEPIPDYRKNLATLQSSFSTKDNEWKYTVKEKQFLQSGNQFYFPRKEKLNELGQPTGEWTTTGDVYSWWHSPAGDGRIEIEDFFDYRAYAPFVRINDGVATLLYYDNQGWTNVVPKIVYLNGKSYWSYGADYPDSIIAGFSRKKILREDGTSFVRDMLVFNNIATGDIEIVGYQKNNSGEYLSIGSVLLFSFDSTNTFKDDYDSTGNVFGYWPACFNNEADKCSILVHCLEDIEDNESAVIKLMECGIIHTADSFSGSSSTIETYRKPKKQEVVYDTISKGDFYVPQDLDGNILNHWAGQAENTSWASTLFNTTVIYRDDNNNYVTAAAPAPETHLYMDAEGTETMVTTMQEYLCPIGINYSDEGNLLIGYIKTSGFTSITAKTETHKRVPQGSFENSVMDITRSIVLPVSTYTQTLSVVLPKRELLGKTYTDSISIQHNYTGKVTATYLEVSPGNKNVDFESTIVLDMSKNQIINTPRINICYLSLRNDVCCFSVFTPQKTVDEATHAERSLTYKATYAAEPEVYLKKDRKCTYIDDNTMESSTLTEYVYLCFVEGFEVYRYSANKLSVYNTNTDIWSEFSSTEREFSDNTTSITDYVNKYTQNITTVSDSVVNSYLYNEVSIPDLGGFHGKAYFEKFFRDRFSKYRNDGVSYISIFPFSISKSSFPSINIDFMDPYWLDNFITGTLLVVDKYPVSALYNEDGTVRWTISNQMDVTMSLSDTYEYFQYGYYSPVDDKDSFNIVPYYSKLYYNAQNNAGFCFSFDERYNEENSFMPWLVSLRLKLYYYEAGFVLKNLDIIPNNTVCLTNHGPIQLLPLKPASKPHPEFTSDTLTLHPIGLY